MLSESKTGGKGSRKNPASLKRIDGACVSRLRKIDVCWEPSEEWRFMNRSALLFKDVCRVKITGGVPKKESMFGS